MACRASPAKLMYGLRREATGCSLDRDDGHPSQTSPDTPLACAGPIRSTGVIVASMIAEGSPRQELRLDYLNYPRSGAGIARWPIFRGPRGGRVVTSRRADSRSM